MEKPLLAIETSVATARIVVMDDRESCLFAAERTAARHSANLLSMVNDVLVGAGLTVKDLGAIACGAGPGSFTGLRVGMAVAKGLAYPSNLPLILESSLTILAQDLVELDRSVRYVLPSLDAGKGQVYGRVYEVQSDQVVPINPEDWVADPEILCSLSLATLGSARFVTGGSGIDRYLDVFRTNFSVDQVLEKVSGPSALTLARRAIRRQRLKDFDDLEHAVPRYGRPPDITRSKKPLLCG